MSSGTNSERITQNNTIIGNNNTAIDNFKTAINNLPTRAVTQSKSVTIQENTTTTITPDNGYDGLSSVAVTTNIPTSDSNAKAKTVSESGSGKDLILKLPTITLNSSADNFFSGLGGLQEVESVILSNSITSVNNMFSSCSSLITAPSMNTGNITSMGGTFFMCSNLVNVPLYDTTNMVTMTGAFQYSNKLSNDSLNNILAMCINAVNYSGTKTLADIGINRTNATTCASLSNWSNFVSAGWSSGY